MFQRETTDTPLACPDCGTTLQPTDQLLRCAAHGAFFSYGPQLLVRAAAAELPPELPAAALLPWERLDDEL